MKKSNYKSQLFFLYNTNFSFNYLNVGFQIFTNIISIFFIKSWNLHRRCNQHLHIHRRRSHQVVLNSIELCWRLSRVHKLVGLPTLLLPIPNHVPSRLLLLVALHARLNKNDVIGINSLKHNNFYQKWIITTRRLKKVKSWNSILSFSYLGNW